MGNYKSIGNKSGRGIHLSAIIIIVVGLIAIAVAATITEAYCEFFGLLLIVSLASVLIGAVLGFLFGIPKFNREYDPAESRRGTIRYNPNTNLEDISDWLTKIIIGVTLTQLGKIPNYLQSLADLIVINSNNHQLDNSFARTVIISAIIYFVIAGFIIGYIYTRIYLPNLFSIMEENRLKEAEIAIWRRGAEIEPSPQNRKEAPSELSALTDEELLLLKKIKSQNNEISLREKLTLSEHAALNVLLAKGILKTVQQGKTNLSPYVKVLNPNLLEQID